MRLSDVRIGGCHCLGIILAFCRSPNPFGSVKAIDSMCLHVTADVLAPAVEGKDLPIFKRMTLVSEQSSLHNSLGIVWDIQWPSTVGIGTVCSLL